MTRFWHIIIQLGLLSGQIANLLEPIVAPEHKVYLLTFLSLAQLVVGVVAHEYNTDGTPQAVAFQKK